MIATAYRVYKGSSESGDGEQRLEAKLDALLRDQGLNPDDIERRLPAIYRRTPQERKVGRHASETR